MPRSEILSDGIQDDFEALPTAGEFWPEGRLDVAITPQDIREKRDTRWWQRLAERLVELNWTKADLSRHADVAYDSVNKYLRGSVDKPRGDILEKLARAVGRDTRWLLFGDTPRHLLKDLLQANQYRQQKMYSAAFSAAHEALQTLEAKKRYPANDVFSFTQSCLLSWTQLPRFSDLEKGVDLFSNHRAALSNAVRNRFFTVPVPDESMAPNFQPDEALVFELDAICKQDDFVIVSRKSDDALHFRQISIATTDNGAQAAGAFRPINRKFEEFKLDPKDPIRIIGRLALHLPGVVVPTPSPQ